jgi:membrane-bound serine protease (ClpP class)
VGAMWERRNANLAAWIAGLLLLSFPGGSLAASDQGKTSQTLSSIAIVAPIEGMIDLGLVPFVERVLREAEQAGAVVVVLDINTFGGRVDAAVALRDLLLRSPVRTVAFVNKRAISAGALIALAAEKVAVASGATIGAAAPVQLGPPGVAARPVEEKTVSYVRKEFRATADARGRSGIIAEAMVDADVAIPKVIEKGKLLTLTTEDALEHRIADYQADSLSELLDQLGIAGAELRPLKENWAEHVVRFLTHPVVSSLLMSLAILGLFVELRTPGFGVPGFVGLLCLVAFFWGHFLVHLVGWEELLLVTLGFALLAVEILVLPGFGIAGVGGILALLAALTLSLLGAGATISTIVNAGARVTLSTGVAMIAALLLLRFLPLTPAGRKLVLSGSLPAGGGAGAQGPDQRGELVGMIGASLTPLRPAGIVELNGKRVDVVSQGEFIAPGRPVEVVEQAGSRIVVRAAQPATDKESP